jgi:Na+/alanine symporter
LLYFGVGVYGFAYRDKLSVSLCVFRAAGPAFISRGIRREMVCCLFAVVSIISAGVLLPGVQANSVADGIQNALK